jgi:hypothetical protein
MAGDVAYDRQLDQSMGDTCHHYKDDTWHRMTSAVDWAGTMAGYVANTWGIQHSTLGIILLVVEVPRGPGHGLPRGTLWLVSGFVQNLYGFTGVEPPTYPPGCGLAGSG